jgi:hypothetical protein
MATLFERHKSPLPTQLEKLSSPISIIIVLIAGGFLNKFGEVIFDLVSNFIGGNTSGFVGLIIRLLTQSIPVQLNLPALVVFVFLFIPLYRFFDKLLLGLFKDVIIFEDDFSFGNKGWRLNYWGSNNPDKTCRIEQSSMVFEAEDQELQSSQKENGAYYDLHEKIYKGSRYEVICWVRSGASSTMGFKLWVHDTKGGGEMKSSTNFIKPDSDYQEVKVQFVGTDSNALRIHLHYKPGKGKIFVDRVRAVKL